jgi:hypothetical protein
MAADTSLPLRESVCRSADLEISEPKLGLPAGICVHLCKSVVNEALTLGFMAGFSPQIGADLPRFFPVFKGWRIRTRGY